MILNPNAPDYKAWQQASSDTSRYSKLFFDNRDSNPAEAERYKSLYEASRSKQNELASKVREYSSQQSTPFNRGGTASFVDPGEKKDSEDIWRTIREWQENTDTYTAKPKTVKQYTPQEVEYNAPTYLWGRKPDIPVSEPAPTEFSDTYKKTIRSLSDLRSYSGWQEKIKEGIIRKYKSIDNYTNSALKALDKELEKWNINQYEAKALRKAIGEYAASLSDTNKTQSMVGSMEWDPWSLWKQEIKTGQYTDSDWNERYLYSTIDLDKISNQVSNSVFSNKIFQTNFQKYIQALESQIKEQREVLDNKNSELRDLYSKQEEQFKSRFWDIYSDIENQENEMKSRFSDIETDIADYYNDVSESLTKQAGREKAWLSSEMKAKWLTNAFIDNSVSEIDDKYAARRTKHQWDYVNQMKDLADKYNNLYNTVRWAKTDLSQSELRFTNSLIERAKELTDNAAKFDSESIETLYKPLSSILEQKVDESKATEVSAEKKKAALVNYSNWDAEFRRKVLYDYLGQLYSNWVDVTKISQWDLITASDNADLSLALVSLMNSTWLSKTVEPAVAKDAAATIINKYSSSWSSDSAAEPDAAPELESAPGKASDQTLESDPDPVEEKEEDIPLPEDQTQKPEEVIYWPREPTPEERDSVKNEEKEKIQTSYDDALKKISMETSFSFEEVKELVGRGVGENLAQKKWVWENSEHYIRLLNNGFVKFLKGKLFD